MSKLLWHEVSPKEEQLNIVPAGRFLDENGWFKPGRIINTRHPNAIFACCHGNYAIRQHFDLASNLIPVHCITPFCSDALVSSPNLLPPWFKLRRLPERESVPQTTQLLSLSRVRMSLRDAIFTFTVVCYWLYEENKCCQDSVFSSYINFSQRVQVLA